MYHIELLGVTLVIENKESAEYIQEELESISTMQVLSGGTCWARDSEDHTRFCFRTGDSDVYINFYKYKMRHYSVEIAGIGVVAGGHGLHMTMLPNFFEKVKKHVFFPEFRYVIDSKELARLKSLIKERTGMTAYGILNGGLGHTRLFLSFSKKKIKDIEETERILTKALFDQPQFKEVKYVSVDEYGKLLFEFIFDLNFKGNAYDVKFIYELYQ